MKKPKATHELPHKKKVKLYKNGLNYDYANAKLYGESLGLVWLCDDFVRAADTEALELGFTQEQVDMAMRHHLWQVKWLFTPQSYPWRSRILLACHFLFGQKKNN